MEGLEALAAIVAFFFLLFLLASGRVPKDLELWGYALGGGILLVGIVVGIREGRVWKRRK
jgi:hypothetical protein